MVTTIELDEQGQLIFVRRASGDDDVARLAREVAAVERLTGPGVLPILSAEHQDDGGLRVATAFAGGGSLADLPAPSPVTLAPLAAAIADTLARAHSLGIVHGAVEADHVLLDSAGAPVVSGWCARDPRGPDAPTAADDLAAFGRLLIGLGADDERQPAAVRLAAARAAEPGGTAQLSMASLADVFRASSSHAEPPRVRRRDPGPGVEADHSRTGRHQAPRRGSRGRTGRVALGVVIAGVVTGTALGVAGRTAPAEDGNGPAASSATPPPLEGDDVAPHRPDPVAGRWSPVEVGRCVPVDGAAGGSPGPTGRCQQPVIEQGVVTVGRSRWSVGHADDLVLLGLWDCGDVPTPAVIRPTTGEVWVFPRWAAGGEEVAADRVAELGGVAWAVPLDDDDDGCHEIGLARHDGSRAIVDPRSGA